jgi:predicted nucleic acid-binding protein
MAGLPHLVDSNVLLRLSKHDDPRYPAIRACVLILRERDAPLCYTSQTLAEFWNVSTRPVANNGFGLSISETDGHAHQIERAFTFLADSEAVHREWRRLVVVHQVKGAKVHDARLVAAMRVHGITHLLTFNRPDFLRYADITVVNPA